MGLRDSEPWICSCRGFCCNLNFSSRQVQMRFCLAKHSAVHFSLSQRLGRRLVVNMFKAKGLDRNSHDIAHLFIGLQEM